MSDQSSNSHVARLPKPPHTLYLIDISSFIFRAFFAIRSLKNQSGEPTNAVYGVATMLAKLAEEAKPEYLAVVYDSKEPSFRKEVYPEYKANRSEPPEELVPQFARIEALVRGFEIHSYRQSGVEADDLIATLTGKWLRASPNNEVVIVSSDKDLMQLVGPKVVLWDTMSNKIYGPKEVEEKFGVQPQQVRDYLALVGDSSDNIPGVPSIGPKSASDLLKEYGNLENLLETTRAGKIPGKKGEALQKYEAEALLSAQLATVKEDLDLDIPLESLKYHFHLTDAVLELLRELDFNSLIIRWKADLAKKNNSKDSSKGKDNEEENQEFAGEVSSGVKGSASSPLSSLSMFFQTVSTESQFCALLESLENTKEFGVDLETTSLNPREAEIVGIALCPMDENPQISYYIPLRHQGASTVQLPEKWVFEKLRPFLEDPKYKKIGQNLKFDWSVFYQKGIFPKGIGADTMIAAYLLDPDGRHNLQSLSLKYLNYEVLSYEDVCGKGKDQICFDQVSVDVATRYSAEDAWLAVRLWNQFKPLLEAEGLMDVFTRIELPLIQILVEMELEGVCVDSAWLEKLSQEFSVELAQIESRVQAYAKHPVNLNSPKQLAGLLFDELQLPTQAKTKTGLSTDARVLETLAPLHEVPRLLLEYREISKLKGTYVDPLPLLKDLQTGKIHASFHQTVAATGRLSSSNPNLQNIPVRTERGMKIRRAFIPSPGNVLVSADYSQIELRLLAHMSGDPELVHAFQNDEDVHTKTASDLFSVPLDQVDERHRAIAKAINFGLMYGKTAFGLSQELKIPRKEAQEVIDRYFKKYSAVKEFLDSQIGRAREKGYVSTLMGRKRWLPDIRSRNPAIRTNAERMAMNTPIQGTAADLIKLAMIQVSERLKRGAYRSRMIIQVHDEIVLDCPSQEVPAVKRLVAESMESAMVSSVPLRVNLGSGKNWMELS